MIIRYLIFFGICLNINFKTFGTSQVPDLLIYEGDTLQLFSNPLEDLYNEKNLRPKSFGIRSSWSTACWRGYRATWLIEDDILYLVAIGTCHYYRSHKITASVLESLSTILPPDILLKIKSANDGTEYDERELFLFLKKKLKRSDYRKYRERIAEVSLVPEEYANLKELFPVRFANGRVRADWFSGILRVPKGKLLSYVHMGYMSTYESELVFEIDNSKVVDFRVHSNEVRNLKEGYGILTATSYSFAVPVSWLDGKSYKYALSDSILYRDPKNMIFLECYARFNQERLNPEMRREKVSTTLDSLIEAFNDYEFEERKHDDVRWGTTGWADGYNSADEEFIRLFTIVNINTQMIMAFRSKLKSEDFYQLAQYMIRTTQLIEFGY